MANRYAVASGNWSNASSVWSDTDGGSPGAFVPADNDTVVIAAGVAVKVDVDQSAWANGLAGVTIRGGVSPGLIYWSNGASGTLKIKTGTTLNGTTSTNRGRLLANNDGDWATGTPLQQSDKAVLLLDGTASVNCVNVDVKLLASQPTTKYVELYGTSYSCADQTTGVNTSTGVITFGSAPPTAGTMVALRSTGTLPGGLDADVLYYVRVVSGNTCKLAYRNGDGYVVPLTSTGSGTLTMYAGHTSSSTKTFSVVQDVTGESTYWTTTADRNRVSVVDWWGTSVDQQRDTLATITSSALTVTTNNLAAKSPLARCYLISRNVAVRSTTTATTTVYLFNFDTATHAGVFGCEISSTYQPGTHTSMYGVGVYKGGSHTLTGSILCGLYYGVSTFASAATIDCWIVSCYQAGVYCDNSTVSGHIAGCTSTSWRYGSGLTFAAGFMAFGSNAGPDVVNYSTIGGTWLGICGTCMSNCTSSQISARITNPQTGGTGCTGSTITGGSIVIGAAAAAWSTASYMTIAGTVLGSQYAILSLTQSFFYGASTLCQWAVSSCSGLTLGRGCSFSSSQSADLVASVNRVRGFGASLNSSSQVITYKHVDAAYLDVDHGVMIEDLGGVSGYIGGWTLGGYTKTYSWASAESSFGELGAPPVAEPAAVNVHFFEDSDRDAFWEVPLQGVAGQPITVTCYVKLSATSNWTTFPKVSIDDPGKAYLQTGWELASAQAASNTDWQTLTVTYTPTVSGSLWLRFKGRGGVAAGTGTNKAYWFWAITQGSGSPGGSTEHAYVFAA